MMGVGGLRVGMAGGHVCVSSKNPCSLRDRGGKAPFPVSSFPCLLVPKLRLGTRVRETPFRETEFPGSAFPNGVWERGAIWERGAGRGDAAGSSALLLGRGRLVTDPGDLGDEVVERGVGQRGGGGKAGRIAGGKSRQ